jgi:hypothetical protein
MRNIIRAVDEASAMPGKRIRTCMAILAMLSNGAPNAADSPSRKNWFGDPFFQARNGMPECPLPLGPLLTEAEMKSESHSRVERGTSCWIAGECKQPNAYLYDAAIARAIQERLDKSAEFGDASLWITVKRRLVWVEGCMADARRVAELEVLIQSVPDVERVIVDVMPDVSGKPPYPTLDPGRNQ